MKNRHLAIFGLLMVTVFMMGTASAADMSDNLTVPDSNQELADELSENLNDNDELDTPLSSNLEDFQMGDVNGQSKRIELVENEDYQVYIPKVSHLNDPYSIIVIDMPVDAKGNVSIFVDDVELYNQNVSVGGNGIYVGNLNYGNHRVLINYTGDDRYEGFVKSGLTQTTFIHASIFQQEFGYGEGYLFCEVTLDSGITGRIKVLIDGREILDEKYDSKHPPYRNYDGLHETYEIRYYGGNHKDVTIKGSLVGDSEEENNLKLYVPTKLMVNKTHYLTFYCDDDWGELIFSGMINSTVDVHYGKNEIPISCQNVGRYTLNVSYNDYTLTKRITVGDWGPDADIEPNADYPDEMTYGQNMEFKLDKYYNATLVFYIVNRYNGWSLSVGEFDLNRTKTICLNRTFIENAFSNGLAEAVLNENYYLHGSKCICLEPKIYNGFATFSYPSITVNFKSKLAGLKDTSLTYLESKTIKITAYDIFGKLAGKDKVVKLKIGKKTYSAKTNKNSVATFKIPNTLTPGKYTLKATYKISQITKKLTVKHALTLNTVKVKKSAKKLVLTAKISKKLKGKKVTFKFNGKKYASKTNGKGVAKVTVPKSVLSKLKPGKKITYQATYIKDTIKKTVKVQK